MAVNGGDRCPLYQTIEYEVEWQGGAHTWEHGAHLIRSSTYALRKQLLRVGKQKLRRRNNSWWEERKARGMPVTCGRPRAQELRAFRDWTRQGAPPLYVHPNVMRSTPDKGGVPTMYGGVLDEARAREGEDKPISRMAKHAHRSHRARSHVHEKSEEPPVKRDHKADTYTTDAHGGEAGELPALLPSEIAMINAIHHNPFDEGEREEVRRHPVARMFVRVAAMENGEVVLGDQEAGEALRVNIDKDEIKAMNGEKGKELNKKVLTLAMKLYARDMYTDVVAGDGSKKDDAAQPWDTTYNTGPTSYGHYGGPGMEPETTGAPGTLGAYARFRTAVPTAREMAQAITASSRGHRIGDEADTMLAELTAILTYLSAVSRRADAKEARVLVMSDCLNALRAIEETWRGRGDPYRQRAGGATMEAINTIRESLDLVVFLYVPSHAGVVPNAYADGVAKAFLKREHRLRTGQIVARLVKSRSVVYV